MAQIWIKAGTQVESRHLTKKGMKYETVQTTLDVTMDQAQLITMPDGNDYYEYPLTFGNARRVTCRVAREDATLVSEQDEEWPSDDE